MWAWTAAALDQEATELLQLRIFLKWKHESVTSIMIPSVFADIAGVKISATDEWLKSEQIFIPAYYKFLFQNFYSRAKEE